MEEKKIQLNKEQKEAVFHKEGPLLIVAGAGTGKTALITSRIAYLIKEGLASSDEILALTFTEKAAGEMEERVDNLLPLGYFDLWISTFHSFAEKVLRQDGLDIGLPANFKLLDEYSGYRLVRNNLDKFDLDYYRPMGNQTKFIQALLKHFSRCKDEDISPEEYLNYAEELKQNLDNCLSGGKGADKAMDLFKDAKGKFDKEVAKSEVLRINEAANAYHTYQQLLLEESSLDFGDLINYCLKLFRQRPNILEKYRRRFKYILLDEFQDTNWAQYELVKILSAPDNNLTVVGDDDQAIYRFRGASMTNILQFKKDYPQAKQVFLKENYRNAQNILDLSYDFIKQNDPNRLEYRLKAEGEKLDKKLKANTKDKGLISVIEESDSAHEAARVVNKIAELKIDDKDTTWDDFAILARSNDQAKELCAFLDEARFPYLLYSSRGLYGKEVILNVINYFRALRNYHDNTAMFRVLNLPMFGFDLEEITSFNYLAHKKTLSLYQVLNRASEFKFTPAKQQKADKFLKIFKKHAYSARDEKASDVLLAFIYDSGYIDHLLKQGDELYNESTALLSALAKRIKEFEKEAEDKTVKSFLEELEAEIEAGEQGGLPFNPDSGPEAIRVMTIHAAKGLEFKYVFVANMVDKRFPTIERKEEIEIPDALVKEQVSTGDHHLEEERRLFYVAATRAKRGIFFSWAKDVGGKREKRPSRFLVEAGLIKDLSKDDDDRIEKKPEIDLLKKKKKKEPSVFKPAIPKAFSYSQLAAYSKCPRQYLYSFILKVPTKGSYAMAFGKTMHTTMQKIFEEVSRAGQSSQGSLFGEDKAEKEEPITLEECLKIYEESWIDEWYPDKNTKEKYWKEGQATVKDIYEKNKDNWPEVSLLEKRFLIKIEHEGKEYSIKGQIDRIDQLGDKVSLVDYKTGKVKDKLDFSDKEQLLIYQMAADQYLRQPVESLVFHYLKDNSVLKFQAEEKDMEKMKAKIAERIENIKAEDFKATPNKQTCKFCDFKDICEFRKL
ncbi:AAA family ATPase [Candidatus Falkowbacteria bacterium]|nr:AAA family ATPase [Candidatus Falkowbacteria bacterium]